MIAALPLYRHGGLLSYFGGPADDPAVMVLVCRRRDARPRLEADELVAPRRGVELRFAAGALYLAAKGRMFGLRVQAERPESAGRKAPMPRRRRAKARGR
jgi:hypothetical protein